MYQHIPRMYVRLIFHVGIVYLSQLQLIEPVQRLIDHGFTELRSGERLEHCTLIRPIDVDLWPQGWYGLGIREHLDRPFVHADEEDARIEAIPILGADEVDVGEFGRWEEDCPGHLGVQDDGVGVEPSVQKGYQHSAMVSDHKIHPPCPR